MTKSSTLKYFLTLCIIIGFTMAINAQDQLVHEKRCFRDEKGRLFWNKNLPFYINLSIDKTHNDGFFLESDSSGKNTEPYYFDTEGYNFIRTKWVVDKVTRKTKTPKKELVWKVWADGNPPETKIKIFNGKVFTKKNKVFAGSNAQISLVAYDGISGLSKTYISINEKEYQEYSEAITLSEEGVYKIKYYSVDQVGNVERPGSYGFFLDVSAPKTSLQLEGDIFDNIGSGSSKIVLTANDEGSGVKKIVYRLDSNGTEVYKNPIYFKKLSEGSHQISYYSLDALNNEEDKNVYEFFVDKDAPIVTSELIGDRFFANGKEYSSGRTRIKLIAIDNKSGINAVFYSINGNAYKKYSTPFYLTGKAGSYNIKFYGVDNVGNKSNGDSEGESVKAPYLDLTAPSIFKSFIGPTYSQRDTLIISHKTKIKLDAFDKESGIQNIVYKIDDGEEIEYNKPFAVNEKGIHEFSYTGYDHVNNSNQQKMTLLIDTSGPEVIPVFSILPSEFKNIDNEVIPYYPKNTKLFLAGTDDISGLKQIAYSLNNDKPKIYTLPIAGFSRKTMYIMTIEARDILDNTEVKKLKFGIE